MSMSTITNKDNLVVIPNNPSDAYQIGYAIGYQDGKRDAAPRWVRCEEEMPKEYGEYLGYANGDVMFLKFDPDQRDEWKWTSYDAEGSFPLRMCDITHWMPIEPPKEDA